MTKDEWSDELAKKAELELRIIEQRDTIKEYKDNAGTDPVLQKKYKKLKIKTN